MAKNSIVTPHAAVIIWNYRDRKGLENSQIASSEVDQVIINTVSLRSVSTMKSKNNNAGQFEIHLAPTKNWVTAITPGSWLAVLMTRQHITRDDLTKKVDINKIKFFGRIDSVRVNVGVNQQTGARNTEYIVNGKDWGTVFDNTLYIDPSIRTKEMADNPLAYQRLLYQNLVDRFFGKLYTTTQNVQTLINLWGLGDDITNQYEKDTGLQIKPENAFTVPAEVKKYLGLSSNKLASAIRIKDGVLREKQLNDPIYHDEYNSVPDSGGMLNGESLMGSHNFWQLLNGVCNETLNELFCDLRCDYKNGGLELALYKRIRPFIVDKNASILANTKDVMDNNAATANIDHLISRFKNLRKIEIPISDVIAFNAGTNWRDKKNFVEMRVSPTLTRSKLGEILAPSIKLQSQFYDSQSFTREGFRPIFAEAAFFPLDANGEDYDFWTYTDWKYLLKEWYFDTHKMLNGVINFVGQDKYIQVGDNIIVESKVMGPSENHSATHILNRGKSYITAHVEGVSHNFTVNDNGVREFFTSVTFSRGIITNQRGVPFDIYEGKLDQDSSRVSPVKEKNNNTFSTSTDEDPDGKVHGW